MNEEEVEGQLIQAAIQGDQNAFGTLYERYYDSLYRYIFFRVGDSDEAEDLTAVVFIRAWESLPSYRQRSLNYRSWLYRIARNLVIDRHRTQKVTFSLESLQQVPDGKISPDIVNQTSEDVRELMEVIHKLDPLMAEVILCRFVMEMSHAETAQAMACSENYVRVLQYRALKKLRDLLHADGQHDFLDEG
ncbi:MAG: sigma-70 family RNA polymerase sigma factor [Anaerolineaceae bacterium]